MIAPAMVQATINDSDGSNGYSNGDGSAKGSEYSSGDDGGDDGGNDGDNDSGNGNDGDNGSVDTSDGNDDDESVLVCADSAGSNNDESHDERYVCALYAVGEEAVGRSWTKQRGDEEGSDGDSPDSSDDDNDDSDDNSDGGNGGGTFCSVVSTGSERSLLQSERFGWSEPREATAGRSEPIWHIFFDGRGYVPGKEGATRPAF